MKKQTVTIEEAIKKTDEAFETLQTERSVGLKKVQTIQQVKNTALIKEHKRLASKYGTAHPRVQKASARLSYNNRFSSSLAAEIEHVDIQAQVDPLPKDNWRVHGRVFKDTSTPLHELTISFFDDKGEWIREADFVCTDKRGYFNITIPADRESLKKIFNSRTPFLTISNKEGQILYSSEEALSPAPNRSIYREIFLKATTVETKTPPPDTTGGGQVSADGSINDELVVRGVITSEETNLPLAGLTVSLFDENLIFDEELGTTLTSKDGSYRFNYKANDFTKLFDKQPDLYIKVLDTNNKELYNSHEKIRCATGKTEIIDIKI